MWYLVTCPWSPSSFRAAIALALIAFGALQKDGFSAMVEFTAPVFWFFFLLTGSCIVRAAVSRADHCSPL